MPQLGDIKRGKEIGKSTRRQSYIRAACIDCGKERWVRLEHGKPANKRCCGCNVHNIHFKVGKRKSRGYIEVLLRPDDFFYPMVRKSQQRVRWGGYAFEHRLVVAKSLGRNLHLWEFVHHKNHIKDDNRLGNLQLMGNDKHNALTVMETRITKLETKVDEQSKQIRLLRWQLTENREGVGLGTV